MRTLKDLNDLSVVQAQRIKRVVLDALDDAEHFGGCTAVEVHLALLGRERWIGWTIGVACTIDVLEAMLLRGRVEKFEGAGVTTWKVRDDSSEDSFANGQGCQS